MLNVVGARVPQSTQGDETMKNINEVNEHMHDPFYEGNAAISRPLVVEAIQNCNPGRKPLIIKANMPDGKVYTLGCSDDHFGSVGYAKVDAVKTLKKMYADGYAPVNIEAPNKALNGLGKRIALVNITMCKVA